MSPLSTALMLVIAGGSTAAMAEQITCESHSNRAEACGTVQPGSVVRIARQLSNSPCTEGRSWGSNDDSIWVSNGCRAVFDVQPPYDSSNTYDTQTRDGRGQPRYADQDADRVDADQYNESSDEPQHHSDQSRSDRHYARAEQRRERARESCAYQAASDRSFGPEDVRTNDTRWIGEGRLSLSLDTPDGPMTCTVDRDGNVSLSDER